MRITGGMYESEHICCNGGSVQTFLAAPAIQVNICVVRWLIQAPLQERLIRDDNE